MVTRHERKLPVLAPNRSYTVTERACGRRRPHTVRKPSSGKSPSEPTVPEKITETYALAQSEPSGKQPRCRGTRQDYFGACAPSREETTPC